MKKSRRKKLQTMAQRLCRALSLYACGVIFVLLDHPLHAENLPDPTRPPLALEAAPASEAGAVAPTLVLQSVLISPRHRVAIINGETVKLGDFYGTAKVVKISESGVVLKADGNLQTLKLFPSVEKKKPQIVETNIPSKKKSPRSEQNTDKNKEP